MKRTILTVILCLLSAAILAGVVWLVVCMIPKYVEPGSSDPAVGQTGELSAAQRDPEHNRVMQAQVVDQTPDEFAASMKLTLMALGDNLIHNCVYWSAQTSDGGYDFLPFYADIMPTLAQYDLACINQETILVHDEYNVSNYPLFGTPEVIADDLAEAGFDVVTHATNHCYDKLETGLNDTLSYWKNHSEITVLGIHGTEEDTPYRIVEKNGIRLALFNYTYGVNGALPEQRSRIDLLDDPGRVQKQIQSAQSLCDFTIVFAHWGNEDSFTPSTAQQNWAQALADAGADLIIGGHPHVVQPLEQITAEDGRIVPVFYSLGNFLSHQIEAKNMLGGMASVTLEWDQNGKVVVSDCQLLPTVNVIIRKENSDWYLYRPMLLSDYTDEIAAKHHISGTSVQEMNDLFRQITDIGEP